VSDLDQQGMEELTAYMEELWAKEVQPILDASDN